MSDTKRIDTGVEVPESGIVDVKWMEEMLEKVNIFSQELMNYGRAEVFFLAQTNLSAPSYERALAELSFTVETAETYISYLQKRPMLEAIKEKYYTALSLSAAEYINGSVEEALALCDVCVAKYGKLTAANLQKASIDTGAPVKKMSSAALTVEALKKKALHEWLLDEHSLSDDDILQASRIATEGKVEFLEKMLQAYSLLEDWKDFYDIIAKPVKESNNPKALRFLSDIQDASESITEYLTSEKAYNNLSTLKETFENEVYPRISMEAHNES